MDAAGKAARDCKLARGFDVTGEIFASLGRARVAAAGIERVGRVSTFSAKGLPNGFDRRDASDEQPDSSAATTPANAKRMAARVLKAFSR